MATSDLNSGGRENIAVLYEKRYATHFFERSSMVKCT